MTNTEIIESVMRGGTDISCIENSSVTVKLAYTIRFFKRQANDSNFKSIYKQLRKQLGYGTISKEDYNTLVNKLCVCFCNFSNDEAFKHSDNVMVLKKEAQIAIQTILESLGDNSER